MPATLSEVVDVNNEYSSPTIIVGGGGGSDLIAQYLSDVATGANTTETNANSFSVPGNTLDTNGDVLRRVDSFVFAATPANTKRIRIYWGATTVFDSTAVAHSGGALVVESTIVRTGSTSQKCFARVISSGSGTPIDDAAGYQLAAETLSGSVTFRATMTNGTAAANDIVSKLTNIYKEEAAS